MYFLFLQTQFYNRNINQIFYIYRKIITLDRRQSIIFTINEKDHPLIDRLIGTH